ncbi:MAG: RNA polymerase sigma-70 factor [Pedobacter sp.]|nr:MAG: RNA polymerase sigma-70 factor [Pedobacter sp.]
MDLYHRGDESALSHFFDLHYRSLCYFASKFIQDEEEAKDIVSGCFVKFWQGKHIAETEENVKSFLYISCKNSCLNYLKNLASRNRIQNTYYEKLTKEEGYVELEIIRSETLDLLHKEIEALPDKTREVFKLIYFDQLKTDEIAQMLEITEKSVRYYKAKAIESLKTSMFKKGLSAGFLSYLFFLISKN